MGFNNSRVHAELYSRIMLIIIDISLIQQVFQQNERCPFRRGPVRRGPVRRGPVRRGPVQRGPLRRGPLRRGPLRRGPVRGSPVRRGPSLQRAQQVAVGHVVRSLGAFQRVAWGREGF